MLCKDSSYVSEDMLGIKHENCVDRKDKKRLKEHVFAHHTGLDFTSFEGTLSNPGVTRKVDALIDSTTGVMSPQLQVSLKRAHHNQQTHLREAWLCGSWLVAKVPFYQLQGPSLV